MAMRFSRKVMLTAAVAAAAPVLLAGVPNLISYQGKLVDFSGAPVTGATSMRFRIYRGGGGSEVPSAGTLVYHESVLVTPSAEGIVSHMIGSGTPRTGCAEGLCGLAAEDFGDGGTPVWIEAMIDTDGTLGSADDDLLLPRNRMASVGYAYRVGSVEGASGGTVAGTLAATSLTATGGATFGSGGASDITLSFDRAGGSDPTFRWNNSASRFALSHGLAVGADVTLADQVGLSWPTIYNRCTNYPSCSPSGTVNSRMVFGQRSDPLFGQTDNVFLWAYNYDLATGSKVTTGEPMFKQQVETSFWDGNTKIQYIEYNWDYQPAASTSQWRPLQFAIRTGGSGAGAFLDTAEYEFRTCSTCQTAKFTKSGTIEIGEFTGTPSNALTVKRAVPSASSSEYATRSLIDLQLNGAPAGAFEFAGIDGVATWSGASAANSLADLVGTRGHADIPGAAAGSRTIGQYQAGIEGRCWVTASGAGAVGVNGCFGGRFQSSAHGTGSAINVSSLFAVAAVSPATKGGGVTVSGGGGVLVEDQKGYGDAGSQGAILVYAQTGGGGTGAKGNVVMKGGGFDDGHLALDTGHLWYDKTNDRFRAKEQAPTSEGDGVALVTGTGSNSHGVLKWGDGSNPQFTTGNAVCQASGLLCVDVKSLSGSDSNCAAAQGATIFYALCK